MLHRPPALKNDPRGDIFGGSSTPFPLEPFEKRGAFIDYGAWKIKMEKDDPIEDERQRLLTPMFKDNRSNLQMAAYAFDEIAMEALQAAHEIRGAPFSMAEVRRLYGIHSWRVSGEDNAHKKAKPQKNTVKKSGIGFQMSLIPILGPSWSCWPIMLKNKPPTATSLKYRTRRCQFTQRRRGLGVQENSS